MKNYNEHILNHSKETSWWLHDIQGIPLCKVCDDCEDHVKSLYPSWIFNSQYRYYCEDQIEED